jgi:Sad1 / UNC-like C-terminal
MPPRRAARAGSSTPSRTRPSTAQPSTQGNTPGRTTALESTPLPDVEAEQSFAYGSSNTKLLPQQLVAQKKMTIKQIAETLDTGVLQARRNFQAQREAAEQYGMTSSDARAARAARRSSDRESRESSVASDETPVPKAPRHRTRVSQTNTEQWLQDIQEEAESQEAESREADSQEEASSEQQSDPQEARPHEHGHIQGEPGSQPDSSLSTSSQHSLARVRLSPPPRASVEQSSMPDVNRFDQTYTHEHGLHVHGTTQPPSSARGKCLWFVAYVRNSFIVLGDRIWWYLSNYTFHHFRRHFFQVSTVMLFMLAACFMSLMLARMVCNWYGETPWSTEPSRPWHHRVNGMCKYSPSDRFLSRDSTESDARAARACASQVARLAKEVKRQERSVHDMQAKQSLTSATVNELSERQSELLKHQSDLQSKLADAKASQATSSTKAPKSQRRPSALSPIFKRINYASPGLGAIIEPSLTSPTKTKHFPFYQSLLLGSAGIKKYQSRPPIEALKPWSEVGDCWCAASSTHRDGSADAQNMDGKEGRYVQLGIYLGHDIFPDEIVVEHLPLKTTPSPGSAPKEIEVWGEFGHLTQVEFAALQMGPHPLKEVEWYPQLGLLGRLRYDAAANEDGRYVQMFPLDFNQKHQDELWVRKVVLRVKSSWGSENTCLYRVRVHGVPVQAHPGIDWETEKNW